MKRSMIQITILLFAAFLLTACVFRVSGSTVRNQDNYSGAYLVVIPGTYVYYYDGDDDDIFFYGGYWWKPWRNGWYRSGHHSGPWVTIAVVQVPQAVIRLPNGWKMTLRHDDRIPYEDVRDNSRKWERDRYWEKRDWKKDNDYRDGNSRNHDRYDKPDKPRKVDVTAGFDEGQNDNGQERNNDTGDRDNRDKRDKKDREKKKDR